MKLQVAAREDFWDHYLAGVDRNVNKVQLCGERDLGAGVVEEKSRVCSTCVGKTIEDISWQKWSCAGLGEAFELVGLLNGRSANGARHILKCWAPILSCSPATPPKTGLWL